MPVISELPFDHSYVSLSVERDAKRSPGIHLSTILKDYMVTAGVNRKAGKDFTKIEQHLLFEQGFLWERLVKEYTDSDEYRQYEWDRFVELGLKPILDDEAGSGYIIRPGEQQMDGVYLTPDGINLKLFFYEEWKATKISPKRLNRESLPTIKPEWILQCAANCRVFKMTRAMIRVWHYGELPPLVQQFVVDWTAEEIEDAWKRILDHLQFMQRMGRA